MTGRKSKRTTSKPAMITKSASVEQSTSVTPPAVEPALDPPSAASEIRPASAPEKQPAEPEPSRRRWQPDPLPFLSIGLSVEGGPRMTLFRNNRLNQMAIKFDEKPGDEHRARLREAGWRWREAESVWTKQLDRERRAASQLEAERLFTEIGDAIREERGLAGRTGPGG